MILTAPRFKEERKSYPLAEASNYLGICVCTLRKMVREQKIKCARAGRRYVFSKEILDDWLNCKTLTDANSTTKTGD